MQNNKKPVVISGASQRIGLFLTEYFLEKNHPVIVITRKINQSLLNLAQKYESLNFIEKDISTSFLDENFWDDFSIQFGVIYSYIYCSSTFIEDNAFNAEIENLKLQQDVNCNGFIYACTSYAKIASKYKNKTSNFICLLDQKITHPSPQYYSYTLSKIQLASSITYLSKCLAPFVRINAISPGLTLPSGEQSQLQFELQQKKFPWGYGNDCQDIAQTIEFLSAQKSIVGQIITVDAGQHLLDSTENM